MFDGFHARNCALLGSIPSGMFSGDGTLLPGLCASGVRSKGDPNILWGGEHSTSPPPIGTELVGYFNPHDTGTVFGSTYKNLVSGQSDLVIYNGMSYSSGYVNGAGFHSETSGTDLSNPKRFNDSPDFRLTRYFEADGADDFLGPLEATNYDDIETGLYLNYKGAWHVSMWVSFPEQSWEGSGSEMFSCGPQGILTWEGYVARMTETDSAWGQLFDHATDFVFVTTSLAGAAMAGLVTPILPVLIVVAFSQYVMDSYLLHQQKQLQMNSIARWNGMLYFEFRKLCGSGRLSFFDKTLHFLYMHYVFFKV